MAQRDWGQNPENEWSEKYRTKESRRQARRVLLTFVKFAKTTPLELLKMQTNANTSKDPDERYIVLDLAKKWIDTYKGRRASKVGYLSTVRGFFAYYRRPLPPTDKDWLRSLASDTPAVEGKLTPDRLQTLVGSVSGDARKRSIFLVQLQSFSGPRELCIIGNTMGPYIAEELRKGRNLIELYFEKGRKHRDNPWYSYIGKDACDSLRKWFETRGNPTKEDPLIWPSLTNGGELTPVALQRMFTRMTSRLAFRPKVGTNHSLSSRYGVSVKELRDLAFSLAQQAVGKTNERGETFLESSIEYFGGHTVDPMNYRKIHKLDPDFRRRQYQIAEPYISPISGPPTRNVEAQKRLEQIELENKDLKARLDRLEAISVERLVLAAGLGERTRHRKPKK